MAVWNIGMYSKSVTESSKSVLVEVLRILGSYRDYLVLTGGWAPYFVLERFGEGGQHSGSIDIDFVLNPALIDLRVYETIVSLIEKRGYRPFVATDGEVLPYRFYRSVRSPLDGVEYRIGVDFIFVFSSFTICPGQCIRRYPAIYIYFTYQILCIWNCSFIIYRRIAYRLSVFSCCNAS